MLNLPAVKQRLDGLISDRSNWDSHWNECAEMYQPRKNDFSGFRTSGEKKGQQLLDGTPVHALELMAAGLHGTATNPATKWFALRMSDPRFQEDDGAKIWLSDVERRMWAKMYAPGAGVSTALTEMFYDLGCFGTAIMFVGERKNGGLLFQTRHLAECYIAEDDEGVVDTVYRKTTLTIRQLVQAWGDRDKQGYRRPSATMSERTKKAWDEGKLDETVTVAHAVFPREHRNIRSKRRENMPWASIYFEYDQTEDEAALLEESGFPEFPYIVARWTKRAGEVYGRGPGMTALADCKMLQAMSLTLIKAAQKAADPPLFVPDDGFMGPVRTVPGALNFYRGNREIFPLPTPTSLPFESELIEQLRDRIRSMFYTDILQIVTEREMTAYETATRMQERMRLLGPVLGRLESEMLGPLIDRVFGILDRAGDLPAAPKHLKGSDFSVAFVSPISIAQRQTEAQAIGQVLQHAMPVVQLDPAAVKAVFSSERVLRSLADIFRVDPKLLTTEEEQAQAAQMAQASMATQMGVPMAKAAKDSAGAVNQLGDAQAKGIDLANIAQSLGRQAMLDPKTKAMVEQAGMGGMQ